MLHHTSKIVTALDKSTRRKIFYAMVLLFGLAAPLALLYSRGYVFNLQNRGLVATGGVFVKTVQAGTKVFIDSNFYRETSFIAQGALVTNLVPRRYALRVEKDGFQPWVKSARVSGEEVIEFRNVLLPPATVTPNVVFVTRRPGRGRLVELGGRKEVALELTDTAHEKTAFIVSPEARRADMALVKVSEWVWDSYSQSFILGRRSKGRVDWWRLGAGGEGQDREQLVSFRGLPAGFSAERVTAHPTEDSDFYFFAGGVLFLQGRSSVPVPIAEQIHSYTLGPEHIYFVSRNGFFAESDLNGRNTKILGRKGLFLDSSAPAKIVIGPEGEVAVVDAAGGLFLYRPRLDQELELIAGNILGLDFSLSGDRMLFWDEHRLWVYWLKDNSAQPFDLAGSKKQVFYSEPVIKQAYLDTPGAHIFFSTEREIRMTEVDDRGGVNSYRLIRGKVDGFLIDRDELNLYWLEDRTLFRASLKP